MRFVLLAASLASVIAACGEAPRSFTGKAERGTTAVLAVDEAGNNFRAAPGSDGTFELPVGSLSELSFYVLKNDGTSQSVIFQNPDGSGLTTIIPPSSGIITFGSLSTDALDNLLADSSKDPLSQIDFANAPSGGTATAQSNGGSSGGTDDHKTTICHSTNSAHNPFVKITVDNHALPAHRKHHHGRDIIPAPAEGCPAGDGGNGGGHGNGGGANGGGGDDGGASGSEGEGEGEGATCPPNTEGCTATGSTGGTDGSGTGTGGTGTDGTGGTGTGGTDGSGTGTGGTGTDGTGTGSTTGGGEGEGEGEGAAEIPPQG